MGFAVKNETNNATKRSPLWRCPNNSLVELRDGTRLLYYHADGMYSLCRDMSGELCHPTAWTAVEVVRPLTAEEKAQ